MKAHTMFVAINKYTEIMKMAKRLNLEVSLDDTGICVSDKDKPMFNSDRMEDVESFLKGIIYCLNDTKDSSV